LRKGAESARAWIISLLTMYEIFGRETLIKSKEKLQEALL
jgi:hypothetical protein